MRTEDFGQQMEKYKAFSMSIAKQQELHELMLLLKQFLVIKIDTKIKTLKTGHLPR